MYIKFALMTISAFKQKSLTRFFEHNFSELRELESSKNSLLFPMFFSRTIKHLSTFKYIYIYIYTHTHIYITFSGFFQDLTSDHQINFDVNSHVSLHGG